MPQPLSNLADNRRLVTLAARSGLGRPTNSRWPGLDVSGPQIALAIDGEGVEAAILHPEPRLDRRAHDFGARRPCLPPRLTQPGGHERHGPPGGEGVALHLDQGDRTRREAAVVVEDRIDAVLPALVGQAALGARA